MESKNRFSGLLSFLHSRWAALAMLATVSAAAITILAANINSFTVLDGGNRYVVSTLSSDPAKVLKLAGVSVSEYDDVSRKGNSNEITIDRSFVVNVTVDGVTTPVHMTGGTVGDALQQMGVDVAGYRLVNADVTDTASDGLAVQLCAVKYEKRTETQVLTHETETEYTADLAKGVVQTVQAGRDGEVRRVWRDTLEDGKVVSSVLLSETRVEPIKEIRRIGAKAGVAMSPAPYPIELDGVGQPINYTKKITGKCTAYTSDRGNAGTVCSTGRKAAVGVVAVDPKIIPYGTELYIVSPDGAYVYGYAIAGDTGGACRAGRIVCDLFMNKYDECILFGRRPMNVYFLN